MEEVKEKLLKPFKFDFDKSELIRKIAFIRIVIGLVLLHRYVDILGFSMLAKDVELFNNASIAAILFSTMLVFGVLTPVAIVGLLFFSSVQLFVVNLGNQLMTILLWGFLFYGAGNDLSIDCYLNRFELYKKVYKYLNFLSVEINKQNVAVVNFILLFLYWGITLTASINHLSDVFWFNGEVLKLLLTSPYMTDWYWIISSIREKVPQVVDSILFAGCYVQISWEMLLLPLVYFRLGRLFVIVHGLFFFILALFVFSPGYLAFFELSLWWVVFDKCLITNFLLNKLPYDLQQISSGGTARKALNVFCTISFLVVFTQFFTTPKVLEKISKSSIETTNSLRTKYGRIFLVFAQESINVFNTLDLKMGLSHIVLYETDKDGNYKRLVPYLDIEGGRLSYMRNDLMFFGYSLQWQRLNFNQKFLSGNPEYPLGVTNQLALVVSSLDALLTDPEVSKTRYYTARVFVRDIYETPVSWTQIKSASKFRVKLNKENLKKLKERSSVLYDLPPGHLFSKRREEITKRKLLALIQNERSAKDFWENEN